MDQAIESEPQQVAVLLDRLLEVDVDDQLAILERALRRGEPALRRRALGLGAAVLSDRRLLTFLRDDADDVRRNAGLEMLKLRCSRAFGLAVALLDDDDTDVVLQAVLALGHLRDLRALEPLRRALGHDDPNVRQEAIIALGQLGHPAAVPDLVPFLDGDPWLAAPAIEAFGRLGDSAAVPHLARRLDDPLLGPFVRDSLVRIGGVGAFEALARDWLERAAGAGEAELEADELAERLRQLIHVAERLPGAPPALPGLERALAALAGDEPGSTAGRLATRCRRLLCDPVQRSAGY